MFRRRFQIIYNSLTKLFRINSSPPKKFEVVNESTITPSTRNLGQLRNMSETRPKQCPFCKTNTLSNIARLEEGGKKWLCKKCNYKWL